MNNNRLKKMTPLFPLLFGWMLAACSDDLQTGNGTEGNGLEGDGSWFSLAVTASPGNSTRANPTGGEPGDGSETGFDYENRIDNLLVLFYQAEEQSNAPADTPIDKIFYFDRERIEGDNRTEPVPVNLPAGEYDLLVVTNTGDIRSSLQGKTLGGIRDYLLTSAWQEDNGEYDRFVMTSDGHTVDKVTLCGNPKDEPADATVEVERVAARIDYRAKNSIYNVSDETYGRGKAAITGAVILNKMAAGSYLLKRVAAPVNGALTSSSPITYLGDELPVEGGVQRNFVVDPWTLHKTTANASRNAFNPSAPGAGNRPAEALYDHYYNSFGIHYEPWEAVITAGEPAGDWYRLGYTMENTLRREAQIDAYRTMVVFQARYTPAGYEEGETFYRVRDDIFPTREEAEQAAEGTNALVREYHNGLCYYVWRVRHSDDEDSAEDGIMEYGIVRNNIYRLLVSDIYGLGDEVPFAPEEPTDEPDEPDNPDPEEPDPDEPDNPDNPNNPEDPDEPDYPDYPDNPDPEKPEDANIKVEVTVEDWTELDHKDVYL